MTIARFILGVVCLAWAPALSAQTPPPAPAAAPAPEPVLEKAVLHPFFSDHAVLQRGKPLPVFGWVKPGQRVEVALGAARGAATADREGRWEAVLPAQEAGGPFELRVRVGGPAGTVVTVSDILIGEVWLCSGQSNMAWAVKSADEAQATLATATNPQLRLFRVRTSLKHDPQELMSGKWTPASPETVAPFSAVGYHFGKALQKELNVPVGLVSAAMGGSNVLAWTPLETLATRPELDYAVKKAKTRPDLESLKNKQEQASVLFNGMIAPLAPFALRGVAWYQGETPAHSPQFNREVLWPMLIKSWREHFRDPGLWWGVVQLPNYGKIPDPAPVYGGGWSQWRDVQAAVVEKTPNSFLAVTLDVGDVDVHPRNKRPVGERLARRALASVYGAKDPATGPVLVSGAVAGDTVRLVFKNTAGGLELRTKTGAQTAFALRDAAGAWHGAEARVEGDTLFLRSSAVPEPTAAVYAYTDHPVASLFGRDGLPAAPWRFTR